MYTPQAGDEGTQLLTTAIRDYIAQDVAVGGVVELLPSGADGVLPEGFLTAQTPGPVVLLTMLGDGRSAIGGGVQLVRYIIYAMDRDRGYYLVDKVLERLRKLLNDTAQASAYLTFPPEASLSVLSVVGSGTTASATYPQWKMEGRGLYLFIEVLGLPTAD